MTENITLGTIEQAIEELQAGRPIFVADSPGRENEADIVFSADRVSVQWMAWTIRHSSGYVCAPMPGARADALALPLMVPNSQDPRRTAYTVTVDAAQGVTTGISAGDRQHTISVLADPNSGPQDLIRPGHVLPLRAVPGGVLHRPGHTEASVDLCRLAGVGEVAGICELVNDDGTMMRLPDADALAKREGLILITIEDLIAWREKNDPITESMETESLDHRVAPQKVAKLPTAYGHFLIHGYRDLRTSAGHAALVPDVAHHRGKDGVPLVRIHSECLTGDAFGSLRCDCGPQLHESMRLVAEQGGAVVYLRGQEGRGIGLMAKIAAYDLQDHGRDTVQANLDLGLPVDRREYGGAAAILKDLGLTRIRLLTNNPAKAAGLRAHGIDVVETVRIEVGLTAENHDYLAAKKNSMGHLLNIDDDIVYPRTGDPVENSVNEEK